MTAVLDDPYILLSAEKITDVRSLMPVLEKIMRDPRPLVIVAEKVEGTALQMLVHNHVNGHLRVTAIQAPGFGEKRVHMLEDIAALCGGQGALQGLVVRAGADDRRAPRAGLAGARDQRADRDHRRLGLAGRRRARLSQLRAEMNRASIGTDEDWLTDRIARLSGKAAIISVGAPTNAELKEIRHRVDDSLQATRAAMAEGIVAGGGAALLHAEPGAGRAGRQRRLRDRRGDRPRALSEPVHLIASQRRLRRRRRGQAGLRDGRRPRLRRAGGPLRRHGRDGHHRPAAGGALRAAERRLGRPG
jgi:chaperonin GroEL